MSKSQARRKLREMILQHGSRPSPALHEITFGEYWRDLYIPLRRRAAEVFGLRWECDLGKDRKICSSSTLLGKENFMGAIRRRLSQTKLAVDKRTREALDNWKEICDDTRPEALMFPSEKPNVPFTSRNWLERNLQPVGKELGIRTPLTFQVLRRSFATYNQKQLKNVQAHLAQESTGTTADLYVVEVLEEVRRTQERYASNSRKSLKIW